VWWWNNQRLHTELNMRTPLEIEKTYYAKTESLREVTAFQAKQIGTKPRAIHYIREHLPEWGGPEYPEHIVDFAESRQAALAAHHDLKAQVIERRML
jgi:hypothetical protein